MALHAGRACFPRRLSWQTPALFFGALAGGITVLLHPASRAFQEPLENAYALGVSAALGLFSETASRSGSLLAFEGFVADIVPACTGLFTLTIFLAGVLAFPSSWRAKLWGLLLGSGGIAALNWVRILSLMVIGARWPRAFDFAHLVVWQSAALFFAVFLWLWWLERFARAR